MAGRTLTVPPSPCPAAGSPDVSGVGSAVAGGGEGSWVWAGGVAGGWVSPPPEGDAEGSSLGEGSGVAVGDGAGVGVSAGSGVAVGVGVAAAAALRSWIQAL